MNELVPDRIRPPWNELYNLFMAAPVIAWYVFGLTQILPSVTQQIALAKLFVQTDYSVLPASLVLGILTKVCAIIFFALLIVMFAVRRVPMRVPLGFYPRFVAAAGTFLGVAIVTLPPQELSTELYLASLLLVIGGTAFAIYALLSLARSISIIPEARKLITSGPYAFVRHPLYLGEMVALLGISLQYIWPWSLLLLAAQWVFQFERLRSEERILAQAFPNYADYKACTARLLPGLY
jgi:protein-S-isoprenylcysteine O-methyltransferase Ste14